MAYTTSRHTLPLSLGCMIMRHISWRRAQTHEFVYVSHFLMMIPLIYSTPYNAVFPVSCQAVQRMVLQIKADSPSVPLSLTHLMCLHLIDLPRVPSVYSTHVLTHSRTSSVCLLTLLSLLFSFGLWNVNGKGNQDDCITVSPHCCIGHMDTRDNH